MLDENGEYNPHRRLRKRFCHARSEKGRWRLLYAAARGGGCELRDITADTTSTHITSVRTAGRFLQSNSNSTAFTDDYGLYEYSEENKSVSTVIIWAECKITFTMILMTSGRPGGKYICLDLRRCFSCLNRRPVIAQRKKTTISIALLSQNTDINIIYFEFHQQSDEYYVEVIDYYTQNRQC